jgi:uncharacterized protein YcbK (DUF882 family)
VAEKKTGFEVTRRHFLGAGIASLACLGPIPAFAQIGTPPTRKPAMRKAYERSVSFRHMHTNESVNIVYWIQGQYVPHALKDINHVLRDHRTGDVKRIDPQLVDLLYAMARRLDTSKPFEVVSGYRSPATNAMLRRNSTRVAKSSFHMEGMAIDVRMPGVEPRVLARLAREMSAGGVGFYPRTSFVHLDVGPVRSWNG